jgi:hypothetical protein
MPSCAQRPDVVRLLARELASPRRALCAHIRYIDIEYFIDANICYQMFNYPGKFEDIRNVHAIKPNFR